MNWVFLIMICVFLACIAHDVSKLVRQSTRRNELLDKNNELMIELVDIVQQVVGDDEEDGDDNAETESGGEDNSDDSQVITLDSDASANSDK